MEVELYIFCVPYCSGAIILPNRLSAKWRRRSTGVPRTPYVMSASIEGSAMMHQSMLESSLPLNGQATENTHVIIVRKVLYD